MLESEINEFITRIVGMRQSFPIFMEESARSASNARKELIDKIQTLPDGQDKDGNKIKVPTPEHHFALNRLHRNHDATSKAEELLPGIMLMGVVSQFDVFYAHLVRHVLSIKPNKIYESQKDFKAVEIIKFTSIEEFKENLIEKYVDGVLRDSHHEQIKWVESALNIKLQQDEDLIREFIEITERRNLFVHCDGMINQQYLAVCNRQGINTENLMVGSKLIVDKEYFDRACDLLIEISFKLHQVIWRNITQNADSESANNTANNIIFNLIVSRNYKLAKILGIFWKNHCSKNSSHDHRLMGTLNLAQCYKWLDETEEMNNILQEFSWRGIIIRVRTAFLSIC
ncbi:MAG TPA: hypothetical protein VIM96_08960 [Pseudomonadales bacterium]